MTRYLFILGLITSGVILSGFINILLPVPMINALDVFLGPLSSMEGIFPVVTFYDCLSFFILVQIGIFCFVVYKWVIGS